MPISATPNEPPPSAESTLRALRGHFGDLRDAQDEFEALWRACGRGGRPADEAEAGRLLRRIAGRAELMELAFTTLCILREHPVPTTPRPRR